MKKLEGKVALITSASRGIGLACALKMADEGARVFLGVRRVDDAQRLCEEHRTLGRDMRPVFFEATRTETYAGMVEETVRYGGGLNVLINNFGAGRPEDDLDLVRGSESAFFDLLSLNLGSVYRISKLAVPLMLHCGGGSIVNISSIGGLIPDITRTGYGVSKAAVNNLTQQIAMQYARDGIRCNAVLPGLTATDAALQSMPEAFIESFLSHVPLGRMATPEDIASAALFLASDESTYITGHMLDVAGGYGLGTPQFADAMRTGNS